MSISVSCSDCGKLYKVDDRFAGKRAKCKACGGALIVPKAPTRASGGGASSAPRASSAVSPRKTSKPPGKSKDKAESFSSDVDLSSLEALESTGTVDQSAYEPVTAAEARRRKAELQPGAPVAAAASANRGTSYAEALANRSKGKLAAKDDGPPPEAEPFSLNSLLPHDFFGWFWAVILVAGLLGLANQTLASYAAIGLVLIGVCVVFSGLMPPGALAREEDATVYSLYRFLPGYQIYFIVSRWAETSKCVLRLIQGLLLLVVGGLLVLRAGPTTIVSIFYHPDTSEQSTGGGSGRSRAATTAPEAEPVAPDPASPKGVAIKFLVAMTTGDADSLAALTFNIDPELLSGQAAVVGARRELADQAARRFADATPPEPSMPETPNQLTEAAVKLLNAVPEQIDGDSATLARPPDKPLKLKKVDGVWKVDAGFLFGELTPERGTLAKLGLRKEADTVHLVAGEVAKGQFPTWPAVQKAIKERIQAAQDGDEEYQAAKKAAEAGAPK